MTSHQCYSYRAMRANILHDANSAMSWQKKRSLKMLSARFQDPDKPVPWSVVAKEFDVSEKRAIHCAERALGWLYLQSIGVR